MHKKNTCAYCQSAIKNDAEEFLCPGCSTPYHSDCWNENSGCAVYGCNEKRKIEPSAGAGIISLKDVHVNVEYLFNQHKYEEAIFEAKKYLKIFKNNTELKALYNKAVSFVNAKLKLLEDAQQSFADENYISSKIYYENAIKYADENEYNLIRAKLEVINELLPVQKRRRSINRVLTSVIAVLIVFSLVYLGYYVFVLKEDREFADIEKLDPGSSEDIKTLELQVARYENFLNKYSQGRKSGYAREKVNKFSIILAERFSKDDWRTGLNYINKITYPSEIKYIKDLKAKIENQAAGEYGKYVSAAGQLNKARKYSDAINELDKAIAVAGYFPDAEFSGGVRKLRSNIDLLNKKISYLIKVQSLEKEIIQQEKELISYNSPASEGRSSVYLAVRVNGEIEPGIFVGKEIGSGNLIAVKSSNGAIEPGELLTTLSYKTGNYNYNNGEEGKLIPLYTPSSEVEYAENISTTEREGIFERLKNLRFQKQKLDSMLNLKLM